jgi:hypothetical protein
VPSRESSVLKLNRGKMAEETRGKPQEGCRVQAHIGAEYLPTTSGLQAGVHVPTGVREDFYGVCKTEKKNYFLINTE